MLSNQAKELRLKAIIYVARQYQKWPEPYSTNIQAVSHNGYSWRTDGEKPILSKDEFGIVDTITEDDIKKHIETHKTLQIHGIYNSAIIFDFAKANQLSCDRIGIHQIGKSLVAFTNKNGELHSSYLLVTDEFDYKRVL